MPAAPPQLRALVTGRPSPGDLLAIDGHTSVQFGGDRALRQLIWSSRMVRCRGACSHSTRT
ncbi:Protein of unknown function [Micromonospora lupini str. Lupac 08]|uniref:Uncharacterized protein n=1 Tax=Micromonospora lupini str. Lupac 08 TaxID=1150864 RepID=I0L5E5_9ACTN|nr:Protein of unknown function [Micromonospora lupini str. Lupac 08]